MPSARSKGRGSAAGKVALVAALFAATAATAKPFGLDTDTRLQIALERQGFSVNCIDGVWGEKCDAALAAWLEAQGRAPQASRRDLLKDLENGLAPYRLCRVTSADLASLVAIPAAPADKARLDAMGYETLLEIFAERGHTSQRAMRKMNPSVAWPNPPPGTLVRLPHVATTNPPPKAARIEISLSRYHVRLYDRSGRLIAYYPCSIAAEKRHLPDVGEWHVKGIAPHPNYTYTDPRKDATGKRRKYIYPAGPNNPVGSAWIGLNLPTYGIHGTPNPETIGRAESHGCFRLANWNAERLRDQVSEGTRVIIRD